MDETLLRKYLSTCLVPKTEFKEEWQIFLNCVVRNEKQL